MASYLGSINIGNKLGAYTETMPFAPTFIIGRLHQVRALSGLADVANSVSISFACPRGGNITAGTCWSDDNQNGCYYKELGFINWVDSTNIYSIAGDITSWNSNGFSYNISFNSPFTGGGAIATTLVLEYVAYDSYSITDAFIKIWTVPFVGTPVPYTSTFTYCPFKPDATMHVGSGVYTDPNAPSWSIVDNTQMGFSFGCGDYSDTSFSISNAQNFPGGATNGWNNTAFGIAGSMYTQMEGIGGNITGTILPHGFLANGFNYIISTISADITLATVCLQTTGNKLDSVSADYNNATRTKTFTRTPAINVISILGFTSISTLYSPGNVITQLGFGSVFSANYYPTTNPDLNESIALAYTTYGTPSGWHDAGSVPAADGIGLITDVLFGGTHFIIEQTETVRVYPINAYTTHSGASNSYTYILSSLLSGLTVYCLCINGTTSMQSRAGVILF
jgi:hypothetical protein